MIFDVYNQIKSSELLEMDIASDLYQHCKELETKDRPSVDYMERVQKNINSCMREKLINWIILVAEKYLLQPETIYLTVNCIDRYLSSNSIEKEQLILLGVSCLMIAIKYEEIRAPCLMQMICDITKYNYSKEEILGMEASVLKHLKFQLAAPTPQCFLKRFIYAAEISNKVTSWRLECLASYLSELSLQYYDMLRYDPSLISASAVFLAKFILYPSKLPWTDTLRQYTQYKASQLCGCVRALQFLFIIGEINSGVTAIREKYSQKKYKFAAKKYCPPLIPMEYFHDDSN